MPHGELRNELAPNEVPQGLIDELEAHFRSVTFDLDSNINTETRSMKSGYYRKISDEHITETTVLCPETFKPKVIPADGYPHQSYIVRVNVDDDTNLIVRRVLEAGIVIRK